MTFLTCRRPSLFHGVARFAHPVGSILAKPWDMACSDLFPVTLFTIAFVVVLVRTVWKSDSVFKFENIRTFICKRGYCYEKNSKE
jgi:hypothetical protein